MATKTPKHLKLSKTMLAQIAAYAQDCEEAGWYYGNRAEFWKRHKAIKAWLKQEISARAKSSPRIHAKTDAVIGPMASIKE